jgi:transposase
MGLLEPFFPPPSRVGRPRKWPLRRIVEAILYLLRGGLPWRMLPPCFPPVSAVRRWFYLWRDSRLCLSLNHTLLLIGREVAGRQGSPSAGVIDSQSVKASRTCSKDRRNPAPPSHRRRRESNLPVKRQSFLRCPGGGWRMLPNDFPPLQTVY